MFDDILNKIKGATSALLQDDTKKTAKKPLEIKKKVAENKGEKSSSLKSKARVIRRTDNLPKYKEVLRGKIVITDDQALNYTALLLKEPDDSVLIIASEQTMDLPVDNNYLGIAKQCKELGYRVKRAYATRHVIEIINEQDDSSKELIAEEGKGEVHEQLRHIFRAAKAANTSDVHIEVRSGGADIYLRIDGDKEPHDQMMEDKATTIARILYSSLGKDKDVTFNPRKPQDAKVDMMLDGENVSIRLATIPAAPSGFDMILRILPTEAKEQEYKPLDMLGYSYEHVKLLEIANAIPVGVIILSGVTGSGKTTTLTTMINNKMVESGNKLKAITIEDPPEIIMKNVTHAPVVRRKGEDSSEKFAELMRATLRCDPDILMPGEIRDKATATLLISAVQSGHQVFTTLHAPSALGSIDRMRELGIRSDVLGSHDFIASLVYQSLVTITCDECSISIDEYLRNENTVDLNKKLELIDRITIASKNNPNYRLDNVRFKSSEGCSICKGKGITHREVIAEVIIPDAQMKRFFKDGDDHLAYEYYRESGGKLILDHGLDKMFQGRIDPRSLERKVGRVDMSEPSISAMLNKIRASAESSNSTSVRDDKQEIKSSLKITDAKEKGEVIELREKK